MGYYNPVMNYGERNLARDAASAGANGFIIVDCPPEEVPTIPLLSIPICYASYLHL